MGKFKHIDAAERGVIEAMLVNNRTVGEIARYLGRSRSTIYDEIHRNSEIVVRHRKVMRLPYNAVFAQRYAEEAQERGGHGTKLTKQRVKKVKKYLETGYSPEVIANMPKGVDVSAGTIYNWINYFKINGVRPETHLIMKGKRRKRAINKKSLAAQKKLGRARSIKDGRGIDINKRPKIVNSRRQSFHWEMDGVESKKSKALVLTFLERKSRYMVAIKIKSKSAADVSRGIETFLSKYENQSRSITHDRGQEFMNWQVGQIFMNYGIKEYISHAYSAWERGSNENANRLFRKYFPKGTDFADVTQAQINSAVNRINNTPRKLHNYKSSMHEFTKAINYMNARVAGHSKTKR